MKKIKFIIGICVGLFMCGCEEMFYAWFPDYEITIGFTNNADYALSVYSIFIGCYSEYVIYPDTSLPTKCPPQWGINNISPFSKKELFLTNKPEKIFDYYNTDTISIFVFSTDSLNGLAWEYVASNYVVLQRYDVALNDLDSIWDQLSFPPSKAMRNIKMWPPYGTYDANGHVIKQLPNSV